MPDRRAFDEAQAAHIRRVVESAVEHRLDSRFSLRKNGESWSQWLGKVFTPERVMLAFVAAFTIGGRAVKIETSSAEALELARTTAATNERLTREQEAMRLIIDAQAKTIEHNEGMHATKADVADLQRTLTRAMTLLLPREEFNKGMRERVQAPMENLNRRLDSIDRNTRQQ